MSKRAEGGAEGEKVLLRAALAGLEGAVHPTSIDELWIFPARRNGELESVVIVATAFVEDDPERRRILTAHFSIRHEQGKRRAPRIRSVRQEVHEQGIAPAERIARVVAGVMRRLDEELATLPPQEVGIGGDSERWAELLSGIGDDGTACIARGV